MPYHNPDKFVKALDIVERPYGNYQNYYKLETEKGEILFACTGYGWESIKDGSGYYDLIDYKEFNKAKLRSYFKWFLDWGGWEVVLPILVAFLILFIVYLIIAIPDYFYKKNVCETFASLNGWEYQFKFFGGGCWVHHPDLGWINSITNINIK